MTNERHHDPLTDTPEGATPFNRGERVTLSAEGLLASAVVPGDARAASPGLYCATILSGRVHDPAVVINGQAHHGEVIAVRWDGCRRDSLAVTAYLERIAR